MWLLKAYSSLSEKKSLLGNFAFVLLLIYRIQAMQKSCLPGTQSQNHVHSISSHTTYVPAAPTLPQLPVQLKNKTQELSGVWGRHWAWSSKKIGDRTSECPWKLKWQSFAELCPEQGWGTVGFRLLPPHRLHYSAPLGRKATGPHVASPEGRSSQWSHGRCI